MLCSSLTQENTTPRLAFEILRNFALCSQQYKNQGKIIIDETVKKNLALIAKQNKSERLYRKLSNREVEVLRYLSDGKKNNEISKILNLNEKTISTYKLRLLQKLNVTNLVDLVNKAKTLEIV